MGDKDSHNGRCLNSMLNTCIGICGDCAGNKKGYSLLSFFRNASSKLKRVTLSFVVVRSIRAAVGYPATTNPASIWSSLKRPAVAAKSR